MTRSYAAETAQKHRKKMTHYIIIKNAKAIRGYENEKRALQYARKRAAETSSDVDTIEVYDTLQGDYIYTNQPE